MEVLLRILDLTSSFDPEDFISSAPDTFKELYSNLIFNFNVNHERSYYDKRLLFECLVVSCYEHGGENFYSPFFESSKWKNRFISSVVDDCLSDNPDFSLWTGFLNDNKERKSNKLNPVWPAIWSNIFKSIKYFLIDNRNVTDKEVVGEIIRLHINSFINVCGGKVIYLPSIKRLIADLRREAMSMEFNGSNIRDLARIYRISAPTIYGVLDITGCRRSRCIG